MYDLAIFITKAQPFHKGHEYAIKEAIKVANRVLVLVGSAYSSRSIKNPFTYEERLSMINEWALANRYTNIITDIISDYIYEENQWLTEVQDIVNQTIKKINAKNICIVGVSDYINSFPQWDTIKLEYWGLSNIITKIRDLYFTSKSNYIWKSEVSESTHKFLVDFSSSEDYDRLYKEYNFITEYKKSWLDTPFPSTFTTVNAVVIQSGHILLVKRDSQPGLGLWALPEKFLDIKETQKNTILKELREEIKLKVPVPVLKGSIKKEHTFDFPERSIRGRTITQVFLFQLDDLLDLPRVKGSEESEYAKWFPLSEFYTMESEMYEDHYHISRYMIDNT